MEKITIKPTVKEIVFRGKPEDGHVDVFSYNYEGNAANGLGSLFIVGQVNPGTEDTSYMINLVASLAKREYYSKIDSEPKEAFSKTLRKINEVLQDFFKTKDIDVNIGIFTVAGDNILISRLGKFKMILSRDNQNIDVLNNINLFNKEHIQEKEFSNVISGKVMPKDKIFAFYAGRSITAREKNIKDAFSKLDATEFMDKLGSIKKTNDNFTCASIHLVIDKHKEPAVFKTPQPRELRKTEPVLAKTTKNEDIKISTAEEPTIVRPIEIKPTLSPEPKTESPAPVISKKENVESNVFYPNNNSVKSPSMSEPVQPSESNLIRPTEFSSAKKQNIFDAILKKFKPSGVYIIGSSRSNVLSKKKLAMTGIILGVMVLAVVAKFTFAPYLPIPLPGATTPEEKAANELAGQAQIGLESAKAYIDQNNLLEARKILRSFINDINKETEKTDQLNQIATDIILALDQVDKAVGSLPSLIQETPQTLENDFQAWSFVWSFAVGQNQASEPDANAISYYPYQDNIYVLAQDGVYKITDGLKGRTESVAWLNKDASLPLNPVSLTIDGKVFIISENGVLTTYYKGDKVSEINTSIPVEKGSALLTTTESEYLYLVDKAFGRIYVLTKEAGSLIKTIKLDTQEPISGVSMAEDQTIYILSSDNKVWKVTP